MILKMMNFIFCFKASWVDAKVLKDEYLTPTKVYLLAYYWAATSFSGAGFGDITAQDTTHMILSICINIHGVLFFGYKWYPSHLIFKFYIPYTFCEFISNRYPFWNNNNLTALKSRYVYAKIASLKAMADQVITKFQENLKHLELFLNRERVPLALKKIVIEYWKYQWKRTGGWSVSNVMFHL